MTGDLVVALGLVFVAELGDKSQLLALTLATRHRPLPVLAGVATAAVVMLGFAAALGGVLGTALPRRWVTLGAGIAFLAFAAVTLRGEEDDDPGVGAASGRSAFLTAALAFLVAELGDKTMLATATLSAQGSALGTWLGASLGMTASSALAVGAGRLLGARLDPRTLRLLAAGAFAAVGLVLLVDGIRG